MKMKMFLWAPGRVVGSRYHTYSSYRLSRRCHTVATREPLGSQRPCLPCVTLPPRKRVLERSMNKCVVSQPLLRHLKAIQSRHRLHFLCQKVQSLPYTFPLPQDEPKTKYSQVQTESYNVLAASTCENGTINPRPSWRDSRGTLSGLYIKHAPVHCIIGPPDLLYTQSPS